MTNCPLRSHLADGFRSLHDEAHVGFALWSKGGWYRDNENVRLAKPVEVIGCVEQRTCIGIRYSIGTEVHHVALASRERLNLRAVNIKPGHPNLTLFDKG